MQTTPLIVAVTAVCVLLTGCASSRDSRAHLLDLTDWPTLPARHSASRKDTSLKGFGYVEYVSRSKDGAQFVAFCIRLTNTGKRPTIISSLPSPGKSELMSAKPIPNAKQWSNRAAQCEITITAGKQRIITRRIPILLRTEIAPGRQATLLLPMDVSLPTGKYTAHFRFLPEAPHSGNAIDSFLLDPFVSLARVKVSPVNFEVVARER